MDDYMPAWSPTQSNGSSSPKGGTSRSKHSEMEATSPVTETAKGEENKSPNGLRMGVVSHLPGVRAESRVSSR